MRRLASLPTSSLVESTAGRTLRRAIGAAVLAFAIAAPVQAAINANKTFTPDAVQAGQKSTVTFYFLNNNITAATSLAFTDPLPASVVVATPPNFATTCGGSITQTGGENQVTFSGGTVPAATVNSPGECHLSFDVKSNTAGVYINSVPAGEVTSSQGPNSQNAEATLNVSVLKPITGTKAFVPNILHGYLPEGGPPPVGGVSVVTITLFNANGTQLNNVSFTDTFPTLATGGIKLAPTPNALTSCGGSVTPDAVSVPNKVILAGGAIPAFGSCTITFNVVAEKPLEPPPSNTGVTNTIGSNTISTTEGVGNASISGSVTRLTGGNITKTFSPGTIESAGSAVMTVQVRNYNLTAVTAIDFVDTLPTGLKLGTPALATPAVANDCALPPFAFTPAPAPNDTSFTVSNGSLPASGTGNTFAFCNLRFNVVGTNTGSNVAALVNGPNNIPTGTWSDNVKYNVTAGTLNVNPTNRITGSKSFQPATILQGGVSVATITLTNGGALALSNLAFVDNLATTMGAGYTVAPYPPAAAPTSTCNGTFTATAGATSVSLTGGSLGLGASCTITFPVKAANNAPTGARNNDLNAGTVTATMSDATPISNHVRIRGTLTVNPVATASKSFSPSTVLAGTDSLLTITVTEPAGAVWTGFSVTDNLPTGHTVSPVNPPAPAGNACVGTLNAPSGGTSIQFTSDPLPEAFTSCVIRLNIRTPAGSGGQATNRIVPGGVSVTTASGTFTNPGNIDGSITRTFGNVTMSKAFDPAVVPLLGESMMSVRIVNNGSGAVNLTGVGFTDNLPAGMVLAPVPAPTFTSDNGVPSNCLAGTVTAVAGTAILTMSGGSVAAGRICSLNVKVKAMAAGNLINQMPAGSLSTTQLFTNAEPVAATITSTGLVHLTVTKDDGITELKPGGTTTYTVIVRNLDAEGVADVAGATFTDTPPAGMTFEQWSCSPSPSAICTANGTGPIVDVVTIPKGGMLTYTITAKLATEYLLSTVKNCATIAPPNTVVDVSFADNEACDIDNILRGLTLKKEWVNGIPGDGITVTTTGLANNATVASTANVSAQGTQVFNLAGGTATLPAETFSPGTQSNYTTTVACTGVTPTSSTPGPNSTFTMPDADVVCTYTNTRVSRNITLRKQWVNAIPTNQITVATTGLTPNASVTSTADAEGDNLDAGTPQSVVPGGLVTLPAETFNQGSQASYTTTVACTGATTSSSTLPATFTMPDADVVCTYTNTLATRSLMLRKVWVNGKAGDQITVTTTGLANNATVASTVSATPTDGTPVVNLPGATVTLPAETFNVGNPLHYTTTVSCTGTTPTSSTPGPNTTFTMPDADVVCTYTNTRRSATLQLINIWINAVPGDQLTDAANGILNAAGVALPSVANTPNDTDVGAVVTIYAGELAGLVHGFVTGSGSTYLQSYSCVGNVSPVSLNQLSVTDTDIAIVCTFVNERVVRAPPPGGVAVIPTMSEYGMMLMAAMLAIMGALAMRRGRTTRRR